jgi:chemotaxis methyl-accepting protein methylase/signal transduction histidine kinase/chemotaxis response regulator CheB
MTKQRKVLPRKSTTPTSQVESVASSARVTSSVSERASSTSFPIVGVGASAGGLEAFTQLLDELPFNTGMAFVLIQHLDRTHTSFLAEAIAKTTTMIVTQATDGEPVKPNHIYVIPPNADIAILHGSLTLLTRRDEAGRLHLPIDFFLRSLAEERGNHAIGVILSGTGSDGTEGLRAIKGEDGITFAQDPKSAKFDGMPRSAIDAGVVDYRLQIPELARELVRLSHHPYVSAAELQTPHDEPTLNKIFVLVRNAVGVDFSEYKAPTFARRLARRMALRKVELLQDYLDLLQEDPTEVGSLYEDVLIHVTSFFRDPEVLESLKAHAFPDILKHKSSGEPIRLWIAGCSTGEEVYSLAICLLEFLGESVSVHPVQIFGSDISETAIEKARHGLFPDGAMKDVSDERRKRFFTKLETGYRINKSVRDVCVFARHDLARDAPFSKLDLVSCRNVLIYFGQVLQKRVIPMFHYSLNQGGFLLLGRTENISGFAQLFSPLGKSSKVFARTSATSALRFAPRSEVHVVPSKVIQRGRIEYPRRSGDLAHHLDQVLAARYSPPGVLINEKMEILRFHGATGAYLRPAPGEPQNNIIKMLRGGLVVELRAAMARAKKQMAPVRSEGIDVDQDGSSKTCDLVVLPLTGLHGPQEPLFVVLFEEAISSKGKETVRKTTSRPDTPQETRVHKLEQKLAAAEEYLQSLIGDQDKTNDDLNAANEELISGNEELQSMNEELETAKEELQSTNEELTTVNDELHTRSQEMGEVNSDLLNLLSTVDVPVLILDVNRRIRRFTPKARGILNIIPSDIGRPLDDIKLNLQVANLEQLISEVIETITVHESEVQARDGRWYRMQIRPYKTIDNKIDGAILSLIDIDALKHHVDEMEEAKLEAERANRSKDEFLAVLSHEIRTPLTSMLMQAQSLGRGSTDAKVKRAAETIERGTRTQMKLVDDLLDVSRIVAGKLKIESTLVDLGAVINEAVETVSAPAQKKALKVNVVLDETVGSVLGDPARLQQVVANLLGNAIKFSSENGQVTIVLDSADGHARIKISDTGSGIEPEFLPHVFNRFAQEDGSTVRRHGGLGLGLAITRYLVEAHGGTIHAASAGRDKGATFSVMLPVIGAAADLDEGESFSSDSSARDATKTASHQVLLNDLRILVVDDDLETREAVATMLSGKGAEVRVAESASDAMTAVEDFRPEVLVCDIAMPGEDGYSLIRRVRDLGPDRGGGSIPALALTAFAGEENRRRALSAGFQMYLAKPVDMDHLTQAVADLSHRLTTASADVEQTIASEADPERR